MSNPFFEKSRDIADGFLQNIVFIDDEAYPTKKSNEVDHEFDALKITKAFADKKKICAVYKAENIEDIKNFISISKKADVTIIDWKMKGILTSEEIDLEEDAPDDDIRGVYTKQIIKEVLTEKNVQDNLKLIIVYTGDFTILEEIAEEIFYSLQTEFLGLKKIDSDLSIEFDNFKILIRSKEVNISHAKHLEKFVLRYEQLPDFVLTEFTKMTCGILSNFALLSLSILRNNSHKILALFSKDLDSAFLSHKVLLPNQEDAETLLIELFGDSISDLLFYHKIGGYVNKELINDWIEENIIDEKFEITDKSFTRTKAMIHGLIQSSDTDINKRIKNSFEGNGNLTANQKESFIINSTCLFLTNKDQNKSTKINLEFAKLTHHKSLFLPNNIEPKLTLGTIIKSTKKEIYYICIQQKCDSVRLKIDEERKFLFLPFISTTEEKFDILTHDEVKLKQEKKSFSIRTIIFICNNKDGVIKGVKNDSNKFIFSQKYSSEENEQFEWVLDLKDLHSQRIVAEYASNLSRVGLDESEFLRRSSLLK